jgi:hypothetical protein
MTVVTVVGVFSTAMLVVSALFTILDIQRRKPSTGSLSA